LRQHVEVRVFENLDRARTKVDETSVANPWIELGSEPALE
jgi:hypothetical protein